jgi:hypothetical protein
MLQALRSNPQRARKAVGKSVPAPVEGWDAVSPLAAMKPTRAVVLDNWFPQPGYVEVRKGYADHVNGMGSSTSIQSLMAYHGLTTATDKMFAVAGGNLYDVSSSTTVTEGNDDYTKVLLHFDDTDGSTTITDEAKGTSHTWTANGDAQIDTAQSKFGGSSALFDGTGDYISTPDSADLEFGSSDFTIDCWFRCNAAGGTQIRIAGKCDHAVTASTASFLLFRNASNLIACNIYHSAGSAEVVASDAQYTDAVNTGWHHVAVVRSGSALTMYIDGVAQAITDTISGTVNDNSNALAVGRGGETTGNEWNGWIDEFRISVGTARWTANFTPPTSRYGLTASLTGLANSRWQYVNYTTSANVAYLWMCNGADAPRHYNGSVWATPAITTITEEDIIHVNVYKKRIWGVLKDSLDACYLGSDAVAGAGTKFPLGSVFQRGGYLMAMATWTLDSGEGPDDYAVFITSRGEVAIYGGSGSDPADASTFALKGIFYLPAPIGRRCFCKLGADLAVVTIGGVLPLSKALSAAPGTENSISYTLRINKAMNESAQSYAGNFGWELTTFPKGTMAILNVPIAETDTAYQYVMNTLTGAWCRFTGWDFNCFVVFKDNLYTGANDGTVYRAWTGGTDDGTQIDADGQSAFNYFGQIGIGKRFTALQPLVTTNEYNNIAVGVSTDYKDNEVISTPTASSTAAALYDIAIYDTDVYAIDSRNSSDWTTVAGIGQCAAVHFRSLVDSTGDATVQLNGFNITYETGEFY